MPKQVTAYRILIASPSDVPQERKIIPEVIYHWNAINSLRRNILLEPVLWESHASPEMGDRPQEIINKQLVENCDILIGTFWTRLGTNTGVADSGTVEEIERFIKAGKPVLLYFSSVPVTLDNLDTEQLEKLKKFRSSYEKKGLIWTYDSMQDLRIKLEGHITSTIDTLDKLPIKPATKENKLVGDDTLTKIVNFNSEFSSFLRRLQSEWKAERDSDPYNLDEGKYILSNACSEVIGFRSRISEEQGTELGNVLDESARRLKVIQRNVLTMGGESFKAFWNEGNQIIEFLETVPGELDRIISHYSSEQVNN